MHCIALHLFYPLLKSMMYFFFSILDIFILLKNACDACEDVAKIGEHIFSKSIEKKKKKNLKWQLILSCVFTVCDVLCV